MSITTPANIGDRAARLAAREAVLRLLAVVASDPRSQRFERIHGSNLVELACSAARYLASDPSVLAIELAPGERPPPEFSLEPLAQALREEPQRLADDHLRVFGLVVSKACPPYEVQYCPQTFSVYRSQRLADIAGFYRAFGVEPGRDAPERADHLACELEFMAWLVSKQRYALHQSGADWSERAEVCGDAQRSFFEEHLAWWVPAFAHALLERATQLEPQPILALALADALAAWVPIERALLGVSPPELLAQPRDDAEPSEEGCGSCSGALDGANP